MVRDLVAAWTTVDGSGINAVAAGLERWHAAYGGGGWSDGDVSASVGGSLRQCGGGPRPDPGRFSWGGR